MKHRHDLDHLRRWDPIYDPVAAHDHFAETGLLHLGYDAALPRELLKSVHGFNDPGTHLPRIDHTVARDKRVDRLEIVGRCLGPADDNHFLRTRRIWPPTPSDRLACPR
jgi:hypothetical protein